MLFSHKGIIFSTGGDFVNGPNVNGLYFPLWFEVASRAPVQNPHTSNFPFRILVQICMLLPLPFCQDPSLASPCFFCLPAECHSYSFPSVSPRRGCEEMSCPTSCSSPSVTCFRPWVKTLWWLQYKFLLYRIIILLLLCREAIGFLPIFDTPTYFTMSY